MNLGVIFGGKSCEHNISVITGIQVINAASVRHNIIPIYIDNGGKWWTGKKLVTVDNVHNKKIERKSVHLRPSSNCLYYDKGRVATHLDACIVACHGLGGEDGTVQGLLELSGIPYTGSGVFGCAAGLDKSVMKKIFKASNLPIVEYVTIERREYNSNLYEIIANIKTTLSFPLIIKPSNLGSSIGITVAHSWQEFFEGMRVAFEWDNSVVVERALSDFVEVNCAVLGGFGEYLASETEQPVGWKEFLTFKDKYEGDKLKGTARKMPADISPQMREKTRTLAVEAFKSLKCEGVARVDFLIEGENIYINEINTIPGSLANYLFAFDGMAFEDLIDKMLRIALKAEKDKKRLKYAYSGGVALHGMGGKLKRGKLRNGGKV